MSDKVPAASLVGARARLSTAERRRQHAEDLTGLIERAEGLRSDLLALQKRLEVASAPSGAQGGVYAAFVSADRIRWSLRSARRFVT